MEKEKNHYEIIGCSPLDSNETIIATAARKMYSVGLEKEKNRIAESRNILIDLKLKDFYDAQLHLETPNPDFRFALQDANPIEQRFFIYYNLYLGVDLLKAIKNLITEERRIQRFHLIRTNEQLIMAGSPEKHQIIYSKSSPEFFLSRLIAAKGIDLFLKEKPTKNDLNLYLSFLDGKVDFDSPAKWISRLSYRLSDSPIIAEAWLKAIFALQRFSLTREETLTYFRIWASSHKISHSAEWVNFWLALFENVQMTKEDVINHFIKIPFFSMGDASVILETFTESLPAPVVFEMLNKIQNETIQSLKAEKKKVTLQELNFLKPFWEKLFRRDAQLQKEFSDKNSWILRLRAKLSTTALCQYLIADSATQSTKETKSR